KAVLLFGGHKTIGKRAELSDVLLARKGTCTKWVGIGHSHFIFNNRAVLEGNDRLGTKGLLIRVMGVVAAGEPGHSEHGELVPQLNGLRAIRTLWRVGIHVVPGAIFQSYGKDVHDGVI